MKFLKNRTVLGIVCIALALIICFLITPLFNASKSSTMRIIRIKNDLKIGQEITKKDIEDVEVGAYNLPTEIMQKSEDVVGKYAAMEMIKGEYILPTKISDTPASENAYLYGLTGEKRAISITIPSFAGGLSGKLISGDIVSIIAVTDSKGNDDETVTVKPDGEEETELPETVTLLVTPKQANILAELEAEGEIHVALVYRGTTENAQKFISAQENLLEELTSKDEKESNAAEGATQEKELQGETAEKEPESEKSEMETVIITTETTTETEKTEVPANAESV